MQYEDFNPLSAKFQADPYSAYASLARRGPLHRTRLGLWLVSGHALASDVLKNRAFRTDYSTAMRQTYGPMYRRHPSLRYLSESFAIDSDKADGEIRKHIARTLSRARVVEHRDAIRATAQRRLEPALKADSVDLLGQFAVPYTLEVVCMLLGVPVRLAAAIPTVSAGLLAALDCARLSTRELEVLDARVQPIAEQFVDWLATPQARESECVAGLLDIARNHELSLESVFCDLLFLLLAGFETTSSSVAQIGWFLARHPDVATELQRGTVDFDAIVEEFVRMFPPVHIVTRRPTVEVELADLTVRPSQTVAVLVAAANRDPSAFADPDTVVPGRKGNQVLTFSAGWHHCLGAVLARHEIEIALQVMLTHPQLRRASDATWRRLGVFRSLQSLCLSGPLSSQLNADNGTLR
jgi:cytochrome P450